MSLKQVRKTSYLNPWFLHIIKRSDTGDPLFPILFIIAAEVLAISLNKLIEREDFIGFGLPQWSDKITHLSYADDTILFCSANKKSVKMMMKVLKPENKSQTSLT